MVMNEQKTRFMAINGNYDTRVPCRLESEDSKNRAL